jgi:amino-acid N-acetyltransferase
LTIRSAGVSDIVPIHRFINEFAAEELMLPLSVGDVTDRLRDFLVAEQGGEFAGVVALHVAWDHLLEIRSLAVRKDLQKRGIGRRLMRAAMGEARRLGAHRVFTLTFVPGYFERFGFQRVDRAQLPQKVWVDCVKCPKFPDCGEVALELALTRAGERKA